MSILEKMIELDADGVDFVPIFADMNDIPPNVICSYTKRDFLENKHLLIPKTNYWFYRIVDGQKTYIKR